MPEEWRGEQREGEGRRRRGRGGEEEEEEKRTEVVFGVVEFGLQLLQLLLQWVHLSLHIASIQHNTARTTSREGKARSKAERGIRGAVRFAGWFPAE